MALKLYRVIFFVKSIASNVIIFHLITFISFGVSISLFTFPSGCFTCFTVIIPYGVGNVPSAKERSPRLGYIRITFDPDSTTWMPSTCVVSQAVFTIFTVRLSYDFYGSRTCPCCFIYLELPLKCSLREILLSREVFH